MKQNKQFDGAIRSFYEALNLTWSPLLFLMSYFKQIQHVNVFWTCEHIWACDFINQGNK